MPSWEIQRLGRQQRTAFDCGQPMLNDWLRHRAGQYDRKGLARTFVAVEPGENLVLGYYALSNHRVVYETLSEDETKGLPSIDIPVVLLGRLAVDRAIQGQGLGECLLIDALRRAVQIAEHIGIRAIEVEAIDESARKFYLKYGFKSLRDDPRHLYLPLHVVHKLGLPPV